MTGHALSADSGSSSVACALFTTDHGLERRLSGKVECLRLPGCALTVKRAAELIPIEALRERRGASPRSLASTCPTSSLGVGMPEPRGAR